MIGHKKTWILIANRAHAKIFEESKPLTLVRAIEHPEGKLKPGDMSSDRSGKSFPRYGSGKPSSLEKANDPSEHEATRFAKELALILHEEGARKTFERLVLVAEPRFLGKLREHLPRPTAAMVERSLSRDIAGLEGQALLEAVQRANEDSRP